MSKSAWSNEAKRFMGCGLAFGEKYHVDCIKTSALIAVFTVLVPCWPFCQHCNAHLVVLKLKDVYVLFLWCTATFSFVKTDQKICSIFWSVFNSGCLCVW